MNDHLTEKQLLDLVDGGVAPNRADGLRAHLAGCASCREALAEVEGFVAAIAAPPAIDEDAHVRAIMTRLDAPRAVPAPARRWGRIVGAASALALAAGLVLVVANGQRGDPGFTARGGEVGASLGRDVGVTILVGLRALEPLAKGTALPADAALSAAYTNVHARPVHLLCFAVDAAGAVHWLYPAFEDPRTDPASVALERADRPRVLPTSVVLDAPAKGRLRIVTIVSEAPRHVSEIERRPAADLVAPALRRDFADASLTELEVEQQ